MAGKMVSAALSSSTNMRHGEGTERAEGEAPAPRRSYDHYACPYFRQVLECVRPCGAFSVAHSAIQRPFHQADGLSAKKWAGSAATRAYPGGESAGRSVATGPGSGSRLPLPARHQACSKVGPGHSKPETRRLRSELIATPAEQRPIESGHSRNSELRRWAQITRPADS